MPYKKMKFKGQQVYVETDRDGKPIMENGRARMVYRRDSDRVYRPNPKNLTELDAETAPVDETPNRPGSRSVSESAVHPGTLLADEPQSGIVAYTDGACIGNPGPAGLGYLIEWPDGERVGRGEPLGEATNNIAELTAILRVLERVEDRDAPFTIFTDSAYAIGVLTRGWKAKANQSLISQIKQELARFSRPVLKKVKGHAGIPENEAVDRLARQAAETQNALDHLDD